MEGEKMSFDFSSESRRRSCESISILVVDDDITCLSIVSAILKKFKYEVVTAKHPNDALCTLRIKGDAFDLVVTDIHMPDMNGFELQEAITHEFHLPVVLMSADKKQGVVAKELRSGASFFISKPVSPDDVKNLWQFAAKKKKNQVVIEEADDCLPEKITTTKQNSCDEVSLSSSAENESKHNRKNLKRKLPRKEKSDEISGENTKSSSTKKQKVIWTNALHNRFLEAIRSIGLDRCVPKKILEVMNVPGLTRENVASHLQKYRLFLRRVTDASSKFHNLENKSSSRFSSLGTSNSLLMPNGLSKPLYENPAHFPGANTAAFPNYQGASPSSYRLISISGSMLKPNITRANLNHQNGCHNDRLFVRLAQNNYHTSPLFQGNFSNASLEGITNNFDVSTLGANRISLSVTPKVSSHNGDSNVFSSLASTDFGHQMNQANYVGYQISNIKHLAESGKEYEGSLNSYNAITSSQNNEFQNNSVNVAATLPSDNILNLDQAAEYLGALPCDVPDNTDGGLLSDVIANYQNLLMPSNQPSVGNLENEGVIQEFSAFSPMYDLTAFDIMATQQPMGEGVLDNTFSDQVNIQNQAQNEGDNAAINPSFYGGTNNWDNHFSSVDQALNQVVQGLTNSEQFGTSSQFNETLVSPIEGDEDVLETLLAFGPFGEDQIQTLEGI